MQDQQDLKKKLDALRQELKQELDEKTTQEKPLNNLEENSTNKMIIPIEANVGLLTKTITILILIAGITGLIYWLYSYLQSRYNFLPNINYIEVVLIYIIYKLFKIKITSIEY